MKYLEKIFEYIDSQGLSASEFERRAGISNGYLANTKKRGADVTAKILDKIREALKDEYYTIFPDETKHSYIEQRREQKLNEVNEGIPIYEDAPYTLGVVQSYRDVPADKADFWVTIPGLRNCNYGVRATGDSMYPLIRNHALVVGEEITDTSFIPSGDIYIIRAKNGLETIKYIQPHETDPKKFVLAPYNEKAKSTDILKKDILKIWKAKAVFNVL